MSESTGERKRVRVAGTPESRREASGARSRRGPGRWLGLGLLGVTAVAGAGLAAYRYVRSTPARRAAAREGGIRATGSVTIERPRDEVYAAWRDLERLPQILTQLESVQVLTGGRSRWMASGPAGSTLTWDAELAEEREGEYLAWSSVGNTPIPNDGSVSFRDHPMGGTEVHATWCFHPFGGRVGRVTAALLGKDPGATLRADLQRFKQRMETGEVVSAQHRSPSARQE